MDTCAQLAAILAQMGPGQAITWLKEQMDGLCDVRVCIVAGLSEAAHAADWGRFQTYVLAAYHQPDGPMAPILCAVLDRWREIRPVYIEDIAEVLGLIRNPVAIDCLERAIRNEPEWDDAGHHFARKCVRSLAEIGTPAAVTALRRIARSDIAPIREEALEALKREGRGMN